jgi:hypothetical protein
VGYIHIDPRDYPGEPWLLTLIDELMRRSGSDHLDRICGEDANGPYCCVYGVLAEGITDEELACLWEEVRAEHRASVRWGAGQRRKRRR